MSIFAELDHILSANDTGYVILTDYADCFYGDPCYPSLEELFVFMHVRKSIYNNGRP